MKYSSCSIALHTYWLISDRKTIMSNINLRQSMNFVRNPKCQYNIHTYNIQIRKISWSDSKFYTWQPEKINLSWHYRRQIWMRIYVQCKFINLLYSLHLHLCLNSLFLRSPSQTKRLASVKISWKTCAPVLSWPQCWTTAASTGASTAQKKLKKTNTKRQRSIRAHQPTNI